MFAIIIYLIILFNFEYEQQFPGNLKNTKCTSLTGSRVISFKEFINLFPRERRVKKKKKKDILSEFTAPGRLFMHSKGKDIFY
jgi:hypothetical protein